MAVLNVTAISGRFLLEQTTSTAQRVLNLLTDLPTRTVPIERADVRDALIEIQAHLDSAVVILYRYAQSRRTTVVSTR